MPWTAESGTTYKLCLLDTNAISEIVKYPEIEGKGFITKFLIHRGYAPCITIYNIIEIRRKSEVYEKFLNSFSDIPFFLLKPYQLLLNDEIISIQDGTSIIPIYNSFSPLGQNSSYNLRCFIDNLFSSKEIIKVERQWIKNDEESLKIWLFYKNNFTPQKKDANSIDAEKYLKESGTQTLTRLNPSWVKKERESNRIPDINQFPSVKVMLYSIYYRLYDPSWEKHYGEVTDVCIMAVSPYMDAIITEKFQANIFNKIRTKVKGLETLNVFKLKDIRNV
ncbi:MAG: hypothetical protein KAU01_12365 [Candidatus Cloacimonetes bacterium]|nr:hypothetical protein [Candidatus Cloacimonadota bacterium]